MWYDPDDDRRAYLLTRHHKEDLLRNWHPAYRNQRLTAMTRLENQIWKYPPVPPPAPQVSPRSLSRIAVRTHTKSSSSRLYPVPSSEPVEPTQQHEENYGWPSSRAVGLHTLPEGLLVDMFSYVVALDPLSPPPHPSALDCPRGIATLMLVCREWRSLVVNSPTLWRCISASRDISWLSLRLSRSRECPLDVHFFSPGGMDPRAAALILGHAKRIRSLTVRPSACPEHQVAMLAPFFERSLPALEALELPPLRGFNSGVETNDLWSTTTYGLPRIVAPRLRSLVLECMTFTNPQAFRWRALRVLKLTDTELFRNTAPASALAELIRAVAQNPSLEELVVHLYHQNPLLNDASAPGVGVDLPVGAPVLYLSRLRTLSIHGSHSVVSAITENIRLPDAIADVDVRVIRASSADSAIDDSENLQFLLPTFQTLLKQMVDVCLVTGSCSQARLVSSPKDPGHRQMKPCFSLEGPSLGREAPFWDDHWEAAGNVKAGLLALSHVLSSVSSVRSLTLKTSIARVRPRWVGLVTPEEVEAESASAAAFWPKLFDDFSSLEELSIIVLPVYEGVRQLAVDILYLLAALRPGPDASTSHAMNANGPLELPRCPSLTRLSIHGHFGRDEKESLEVLQALAECVEARALAGARLKSVDLHYWHWEGDNALRLPGGEHRSVLARVRASVGFLECKFGISACCVGCRQ
ncbi:hypothetical protein C8Q77DRAFT_1132819 [Trametes polyzona]|nr:hypothetical protein C8Q77DRAFT_1132819 [Trametes polyzona]